MPLRAHLGRRLPVVILVTGAALLQALSDDGPPASWRQLRPVAGLGVLPAALGGWRAPAADLLWLRANLAWERRDAPATDALLRAAVALEPDEDYFRLNAARIIAFDLAEWERDPVEPAEVSRRRAARQARRALELLVEGPEASAALLVERARLTHQVLGDRVAAARLYRAAAERPAAPYFAGRLATELLVAEGRIDEARDWLRSWVPRLPPGIPAAQRGRMETRLRELASTGTAGR